MKRFVRVENGSMLGGVATGMAYYFEIDVSLARLLWVALGLSGVGVPVYIIAWLVVPSVPYVTGPGSEWAAPGPAGAPEQRPAPGHPPAPEHQSDAEDPPASEPGPGGQHVPAADEGAAAEQAAAPEQGAPSEHEPAPAVPPSSGSGSAMPAGGGPGGPAAARGAPAVTRGAGPKTAGWILVIIGGILLMQQVAPRLLWWLHGRFFWPLLLVAAGIMLIFRNRS